VYARKPAAVTDIFSFVIEVNKRFFLQKQKLKKFSENMLLELLLDHVVHRCA
jgi:hypothetical protein